MKKSIKGFTLIELLAAVIILAIVLLIAVPQVLKIITKTRKSAFAADAIVAGKDAINKLNETYVSGHTSLPVEGESVTVDIAFLNNEDLKKYTGQVIIKREADKLIPYVTMTDNSNYICNTATEYINLSSVTKDPSCDVDFEGEVDNETEHEESNITVVSATNVNGPVLIKGMTPIKWVDGLLTETTITDSDWFDYSTTSKKWANVKTEDGSMWVWIPRYAYQITSGYHTRTAGTIEVKFLKGTTNTSYDGTTVLAVNQGNNPGSDKNFVTHPAFKFGDEELAGIWVMKFETSNNGGNIASVPNVSSWRSLNISTMFDLSRSMETNSIYGWDATGNEIDTHMIKDVEWGAASYLSWSSYGKNSEVGINNSSTYTTGCAGSSVSASSFAGCAFEYNTVGGQKASTTGNYYGIYDMSGGAYEYTASYLIGGGASLTTYGASLVATDSKYVDKYIGDSDTYQTNYDLNAGYYGNAMYETSSIGSSDYSWNSDRSYFVYSNKPFSERSGNYFFGPNAGVFYFNTSFGASYASNSWRTSLVVSNVDNTKLTANIFSSNTSSTNQNITLTIIASGANFSHIILPDNSTSLTKISTYVVTTNGTYSFTVHDKSGNTVNKSFTVSNIDKVNPSLTLTQSTNSYTNSNVTITAVSSDSETGFDKVLLPDGTYSTSSSAIYNVTTNGTYSFTTYDNAGNSITKTITVSNIDKTAPKFTSCDVTSKTATSATITVAATDTGGSGFYRILRPNSTYSTSASFTYDVTVSGTNTFTAYDNAGNSVACNVTVSINPANAPVLASGMTPIKWSGSTLVATTTSDPYWYDYGTSTKQWANAKTADGSMWVWIPRYAYQITSGYHSSTAGTTTVKFLNGTSNTAFDGTTVAAVNQGNNPGSDKDFVTHPAFKFGNDEVTGIWIMKFEASNNNGNIASVPNVSSWSSQTTGTMFDLSRSMETNSIYGWGITGNGIDTHMIKDVEWGAAAYLSWSAYGKNSEVWINNSSAYITGCAGYAVFASSVAGCEFTYNTTGGKNASTTGNYYGIYDMSGGALERTAAYLVGGGPNLTTNGSSLVAADSKYVDKYIGNSATDQTNYNLNTGYYGNAMYETSSEGSSSFSWNSDYSYFVKSTKPFSGRGGHYSGGGTAGVFFYTSFDGASNSNSSWRASMVVKEGL